MKQIIIAILLLTAMSGKGQSRFPDDSKYDPQLTPLGNLWGYVEKIDRALDSAKHTIDSLTHELSMQRKLLQFNTDMGNYYIKKVDSFRQHGIGVYPGYNPRDTMALGPFYIY